MRARPLEFSTLSASILSILPGCLYSGGVSKADFAALQEEVAALQEENAAQQVALDEAQAKLAALPPAFDTYVTQDDLTGFATESFVQATIGELTSDGGALANVSALNDYVSVTVSGSSTDVYFTGVNIHVQSGAGATDAAVNGLGNLFIGYNEGESFMNRNGSHNLVVGANNAYAGYGNFLAGTYETAKGNYGQIVGGFNNTVDSGGTIISGDGNTNDGSSSVMLGGIHSSMDGDWSVHLSPYYNTSVGDSVLWIGCCTTYAP